MPGHPGRITALDTRISPIGPFRSIAHRGEPLGHRENTLPGIAAAIAAGADLVEIDVKVTRDGEVVLLHDLGLARLWQDRRLITDLDHDQLAALTVDDHRIPTLQETLELIGRSRSGLLIDLDATTWADPSLAVVRAAVEQQAIRAEQVAWCGRPDSLSVIRSEDPTARIVCSWDESDGDGALPDERVLEDLRPEAFNPHWPMLLDPDSGESVRRWIADHGLATCCWTVDDPAVMQELLGLGVNAMITNRITTLQELSAR